MCRNHAATTYAPWEEERERKKRFGGKNENEKKKIKKKNPGLDVYFHFIVRPGDVIDKYICIIRVHAHRIRVQGERYSSAVYAAVRYARRRSLDVTRGIKRERRRKPVRCGIVCWFLGLRRRRHSHRGPAFRRQRSHTKEPRHCA